MSNEKILQFITEKIEDIKIALFYCYSKSPLKIHNTIIETFNVDCNGNITFFIRRPQQVVSQFEQEFLVGLHYFKKGKDYFFKILGKGRIVADPEELAYESDLSPQQINSALTTHLYVKVKILKVDFYDNKYERQNLLLKKIQKVYSHITASIGAISRSFDLETQPSFFHRFGF